MRAKRTLARVPRKWIIYCVFFAVGLFSVYKIHYITADPGKDKECEPLFPDNTESDQISTRATQAANFDWVQKGGVVNDASCLDETAVYGVVAVRNEDDIRSALAYAREHDLKVSIAGVKHSMGGHAFAKGALVLDMTGFNAVEVHTDRNSMTVQSGATWHDIQNKIHPFFAVMAMQSTDIFTVGGSISVNAHGMDHRVGAVENSIRSMRVMLPSGEIRRVSRTENPELYALVVGGYGLFGIILDADLRLAENELYESKREIISYADFPQFFNAIKSDTDVGLMYTHLSTAPGDSYLKEGIVYTYTKAPDQVAPEEIPALAEISSVKLRRLVMNMSKYGSVFQTLRWWSEKYIEPRMESCSISRNAALGAGEGCLVSRNEPMHDSVPYLKNSLKRETDILHEYFIPRDNIVTFIDGMRDIIREDDVNLLNASIRVVNAERGYLTYAPEEAFSVVLYINQKTDDKGNEKMRTATRKLIDLASAEGGRFFLPYQLHYTKEQLRTAYPDIDSFFRLKRVYDPSELLTNTWYETYAKS